MTVDTTLRVRINGEERNVASGISIAALIAELGLNAKRVAIERNLEIVPRSTFAEVSVEDGDQYEIVHFVGGG
jgi:thiazole synthase